MINSIYKTRFLNNKIKMPFLFLLLLLLINFNIVFANQFSDEDSIVAFYTLASKLKTVSTLQRIELLKHYIKSNPDIELGYQQITDIYLYNSMIEQGIEYLHSLTKNEQFNTNANWALARLYFVKGEYTKILEIIKKPIFGNSVSPKIISYFVELEKKIRFASENGLIKVNINFTLDDIESKLSHSSQKLFRFYRYYHNDDFSQALKLYYSLSPEYQKDFELVYNFGYCLLRTNNKEKAELVWRSGLAEAILKDHYYEIARFHSLLGVFLKSKALYDSALYHYNVALNISSKYQWFSRKVIVSRNKALIHAERKKYNLAINNLKDVLDQSKKLYDYKYCSLCCINLGFIYRQLGEFQQALGSIEMGESYAVKSLEFHSLLILKLNKGNLYFNNLKQYALAKKDYNDALKLANIFNNHNMQNRINASLTDILIYEKKYTHAKEKYSEIISTMQDHSELVQKSIYLSRLAKVYTKEHRFEKAREISWQAYLIAVEIDSKVYRSYYLFDIANLDLILGNISDAIASYQYLLKDTNVQKNLDFLSQVYLKLGTAYKKTGDLDAAVQQYALAVEIIEKSRAKFKADRYRIGYFSTKYETFQKLTECFLERYFVYKKTAELDSLFYYTQMSRDRDLKDKIFRTEKEDMENLRSDENFLKADLALRKKQYQIRKQSYNTAGIDWERHVSDLEAAKYTLITQRINSYEKLRSTHTVGRPRIPTLKEIEDQLEKNHRGMLIYHFSEDMSFVFAVTGDSSKVIQLDVQLDTLLAAIDEMMTPFHNVQADNIYEIPFHAGIAHKLYAWLFEPVQNNISLPKQLLILPDNAIINLPFELLLAQKPEREQYFPTDKPDYAQDFLVHNFSFIYNPTLLNPPQKRHKMSRQPDILVYANPFYIQRLDLKPLLSLRQFNGWRFEPLPFAELEAERIKQHYPQTKIVKRDAALEARFKTEAHRYDIIHLATHAFVDSTFDAFSGLAFSLGTDSTDDGMLMGYEISDMDLLCDLVTLSACETGRGKLMEGEGVLGLPRQFLAAGSKSVLMTLWKVDDKFTSQLMPEFYDYYLNKKLSKADALENAKHNMLSLQPNSQGFYYQHPFYWASFVLYGDPGFRKPAISMAFTLISLSLVMGISFIFQFKAYTRTPKSKI